ncbi:MAG: Crp/Fnr family transcriptional regulator [Acidobacteria bacterium]|nr:Crp/Fnr family transcriptional regulator [Acidobacteriota bacterium]
MEHDEVRAAYCVCSGQVKLFCGSPDGRAAIVAIAKAGDVLGARELLLGKPHDLTAITIERTHLRSIPKEPFLDLLRRNGEFSLRLAQKISGELGEAYRKVSGAVYKSPSERLTELLLALCQSHGESTPSGINLKTNLCQEEIAELVGISRRSLSRVLAELRRRGLIECRRRSILVLNPIALFDWLASCRGF